MARRHHREELDELGLRIIVVESNGIYVEPFGRWNGSGQCYPERGLRVRKTFRAEWRRHFPAAA